MKTKIKNTARALGLSAVIVGGANAASAQDIMDEMGRAGSGMSSGGSGDREGGMMDMRLKVAQMLIQTLSEEKTEINTLAAQQAMFKKMGGRDNQRLANLWGRWIREHKAAGPALVRLIQQNGGDPTQAKVLKPPALGSQQQMVSVTHKDHEAAVTTSQMRHGMTESAAIKRAMRKRASLARKHIRQMEPYHKDDMTEMDKMSVQG